MLPWGVCIWEQVPILLLNLKYLCKSHFIFHQDTWNPLKYLKKLFVQFRGRLFGVFYIPHHLRNVSFSAFMATLLGDTRPKSRTACWNWNSGAWWNYESLVSRWGQPLVIKIKEIAFFYIRCGPLELLSYHDEPPSLFLTLSLCVILL